MHTTCTTRNPSKAVLFSIVSYRYSSNPIVLIANFENVKSLEIPEGNVFANLEEEIAFQMLPKHFEKFCYGYVSLQKAQQCLLKIDINTRFPVDNGNLSGYLNELDEMKDDQIEEFMNLIEPFVVKL